MCRVPDRGVSGRRGFAVESAGARICCEGGARVTSNMMVQDVDLFVLRRARWAQVGNRGGWVAIVRAQLALDTILVSPHHCDGSPHRGAANVDLVVQEVLRQKKERTCPELVGPSARCRLVVLAGEREAGGPRKFGRVWGSWRRLKLERCPRFSGNVLNSLGGFDGVLFQHALQPERSQRPCWICGFLVAPTVRCQLVMRLRMTYASISFSERGLYGQTV